MGRQLDEGAGRRFVLPLILYKKERHKDWDGDT